MHNRAVEQLRSDVDLTTAQRNNRDFPDNKRVTINLCSVLDCLKSWIREFSHCHLRSLHGWHAVVTPVPNFSKYILWLKSYYEGTRVHGLGNNFRIKYDKVNGVQIHQIMSEYSNEYTEHWGRADLKKLCKTYGTPRIVSHTVWIWMYFMFRRVRKIAKSNY